MRQENSTQLRVLHLVSANGVAASIQQALFMPLLIKAPKQRVVAEVICLAPDAVAAAVLRQNGIPVHELALSRQRFSLAAFSQLIAVAREFRPEVIHAWGYTAQILAGWLGKRCGSPRVLFSAMGTTPAATGAGFFELQRLKAAARAAARADRIVYSSDAAAAAHRRIGFPEQGYAVIAPGVDSSRFKPDPGARSRVREQLSVPANSFVIGMLAPFQADYDHLTLLRGIGDLVKTQPSVHVLLAGHGVQKGNAPLMAHIGAGNLASRTQLLGEWTDLAGFFNACDVAVSSALTDAGRMNLVMAMLCAVPCVATAVGEQGEVLGQCSIAIETGSPAAIVRGVTRVMEMPAERRAFLAQSSRKHALKNFAQIRSLQQYVQLYGELLGRAEPIAEVPPQVEVEWPIKAPPRAIPVLRVAVLEQPSTRDSVENPSKAVSEWRPAPLPEASAAVPAAPAEELLVSDGDVLQIFESAIMPRPNHVAAAAAASQHAIEEAEDLLAPELLAANAGEEFRPKQVAAATAKSKAVASARVAAGRESTASVRALRSTASVTTVAARPAPSSRNPASELVGTTSAEGTAANGITPATSSSHATPAAAPTRATDELDATLQLDLLGGALLEASRRTRLPD